MRLKVAALGIGTMLGFVFDWARLTDPNTFHRMLTLRSPFVYLLMGSAVAVAAVGIRMLRGRRAPLTGEKIDWSDAPVRRSHVLGGLLFGAGWAVSASCPGPLVAQVGAGRLMAAVTLVGAVAGVKLQLVLASHSDRAEPGHVGEGVTVEVL